MIFMLVEKLCVMVKGSIGVEEVSLKFEMDIIKNEEIYLGFIMFWKWENRPP